MNNIEKYQRALDAKKRKGKRKVKGGNFMDRLTKVTESGRKTRARTAGVLG